MRPHPRNSGEPANAPRLTDNGEGRVHCGQPNTVCDSGGPAIRVPDVSGAVGTPLAHSPPFPVHMRVRHGWALGA